MVFAKLYEVNQSAAACSLRGSSGAALRTALIDLTACSRFFNGKLQQLQQLLSLSGSWSSALSPATFAACPWVVVWFTRRLFTRPQMSVKSQGRPGSKPCRSLAPHAGCEAS